MKRPNKFLFAQDLIEASSKQVHAGFNSMILGEDERSIMDWDASVRGAIMVGYYKAKEMVDAGEIYFKHNFSSSSLFGVEKLREPWWIIKVFKDGDEYCCVGEGFEDLQASDNYAFGKTKNEAIEEYAKLFK